MKTRGPGDKIRSIEVRDRFQYHLRVVYTIHKNVLYHDTQHVLCIHNTSIV